MINFEKIIIDSLLCIITFDTFSPLMGQTVNCYYSIPSQEKLFVVL